MKNDSDAFGTQESVHGTYKSNVIGFILSIALTLAAYFLVTEQLLGNWMLNLALVFLGLTQVIFQLIFFLHLGDEPKPRWNFLAFLFMLSVVVILVAGSLWIMYNLDYRVMTH